MPDLFILGLVALWYKIAGQSLAYFIDLVQLSGPGIYLCPKMLKVESIHAK